MKTDSQILHDLNNYLYGQKSLTQMSIELFYLSDYQKLEKTLMLMQKQQEEELLVLVKRLKKMFETSDGC